MKLMISIIIFLISMSLAVATSEFCYQEFNNQTASCGSIITYSNATSWSFAFNESANLVDGDYSTAAYRKDNEDGTFRINYSIPNITGVQTVNDAIWQLKFNNGTIGGNTSINLSLFSLNCFDSANPSQMKLVISSLNTVGADRLRIRCWKGTQWIGSTRLDLLYTPNIPVAEGWALLFEEGIYWNITTVAPPAPPNGSISNPYKIDSCFYLYNNLTNQSAYYNLTEDLDCISFMNQTKRWFFDSFSGVLWGNNHTIKNVNLTPSTTPNTGFIRLLDGGEVYDLHLNNFKIISPMYGNINYNECGVLVGHLNSGIIDQIAITDSWVECGFDVGSLGGSINRNAPLTVTNVVSYNNTIFSTVCENCNSSNYASGLISKSFGIGDAGNFSDIYTSVDIRLRDDCSCNTADGFMSVQGTMNNYSDLYFEYPLANYTDAFATAKSYTEMVNASESFWTGFDSDIWHFLNAYYPLLEWLAFPNYPPVIEILGISFTDGSYHDFLINGSDVEFHDGNWTFNVTVTDIEGTTESITLYNETSTIFFGSDINNITLGYLDFIEFYQEYNISISSTDDRFNTTIESYNFTIDDSIFPQCTGLDDTEVLNNSFYSWNVFCTDDALYFFNLTCDNGVGNIYQQLSTYYQFQDTRQIINTTICSYEVCDAHTAQTVNMKVKKDKPDTLTFDDKIDIKSRTNTKNVDSIKKKDRYTFEFEYNQIETAIQLEVPIECDYVHSPKYRGWYVCLDSEYWIDFESTDPDDTVTINGHVITIKNKAGKDKYQFESIGKLNCIDGTQTISTFVPSRGILGVNTCPENITNMMGLGIIAMIGLALILFGASNNSGGIGILGSIIMLFTGWILYGCFNLVGATLSLCSMFLIIWFAIRKSPV